MDKSEDYRNIFHWAETQQDGAVPSFKTRKNDPYKVGYLSPLSSCSPSTSPSLFSSPSYSHPHILR